MNFRIVDLMIFTASIAVMIAVYQIDKLLFRQAALLALTSVLSSQAVNRLASSRRSMRFVGAVAGLAAGVIYVCMTYFFREMLYDLFGYDFSGVMFVDSYEYFWSLDALSALIVSLVLGSVLGPMLTMYFGDRDLRRKFQNLIRFSLILFAAVVTLAFFAMLDRLSLFGHARNWTPLMLVVLLVFVVHTHGYLGRMESEYFGESNSVNVGENVDNPDAT